MIIVFHSRSHGRSTKLKYNVRRQKFSRVEIYKDFTEVFISFYKYINRIPTDFHRPPLYLGQECILIMKGNPIRTNILPTNATVAKLGHSINASALALRNFRIASVNTSLNKL